MALIIVFLIVLVLILLFLYGGTQYDATIQPLYKKYSTVVEHLMSKNSGFKIISERNNFLKIGVTNNEVGEINYTFKESPDGMLMIQWNIWNHPELGNLELRWGFNQSTGILNPDNVIANIEFSINKKLEEHFKYRN